MIFMTENSTPVLVTSAALQSNNDLRQVANRLVKTFLPVAIRNKSFFVNEIPENLYIDSNPQLVASVFGGLLSSVVRHTKDSCIKLSAKVYNNVIVMHVKDCSNSNHTVENGLKQLQPIAEKIGGVVSITSYRTNVTTFAFSFPNLPIAA
jgi:hypothetical protein